MGTDLALRVTTLEDDMAAHNSQIELLAMEVRNLDVKMERRFDKLEKDLADVKHDVTSLRQAVNHLKHDMGRLKHDMVDVKDSLKIIINALAI